MVDLMLDSCFKGMDSISKDQVAILVQQYDELVVMPLLKVVMGFLNIDQAASLVLPSLELFWISIGLFGLTAST
jgi:hypothetical protein